MTYLGVVTTFLSAKSQSQRRSSSLNVAKRDSVALRLEASAEIHRSRQPSIRKKSRHESYSRLRFASLITSPRRGRVAPRFVLTPKQNKKKRKNDRAEGNYVNRELTLKAFWRSGSWCLGSNLSSASSSSSSSSSLLPLLLVSS